MSVNLRQRRRRATRRKSVNARLIYTTVEHKIPCHLGNEHFIRISLTKGDQLVSVSTDCSHAKLPSETLEVARVLYKKKLVTCQSFLSHVLNRAKGLHAHPYDLGYPVPQELDATFFDYNNRGTRLFYEHHDLEILKETIEKIKSSDASDPWNNHSVDKARIPFNTRFFSPPDSLSVAAKELSRNITIRPVDRKVDVAMIADIGFDYSNHIAGYLGNGISKVYKNNLEHACRANAWDYQSRWKDGKRTKLCTSCNRWYTSIEQHLKSKLHAVNFEKAAVELLTAIGYRMTQAQRVRDALKRPKNEELDDSHNSET